MHSADQTTHVKIVVMALAAGIALAGLGLSVRTQENYAQIAPIKAGRPTMVTSSDASMVR
jgi:hypothetical protein